MAIFDRVRSAWNAFRSVNDVVQTDYDLGAPTYSASYSPSRSVQRFVSNDRSIITSIYNRISIDVSDIAFRHVKVDDQERYSEDVKSRLNDCLKLETNIDQGPREFIQDLVLSMFDKGCAVIVPVDTVVDPNMSTVFDIYNMRVGEVVKWYPKHVRVSAYNEAKGVREEVTLPKKFCAIVSNPMYSVMNAPNSTLQRLIRKLNLLDTVDEQTGSGKLDIIIQLPYTIKSDARRQQAESRRNDIEMQLKGSQYGIAYADATEKITQLNRPAENNMLEQVKMLVEMLYGQLGITSEVMNGTADEATMINYFNRTVGPILDSIKQSMQRAFLGLSGTRRNQRIMYFKDPFKLVPVSQVAEIADKFTRNEILSSNEIRGFIGIPPAKDPKADQLVNSNMPQSDTGVPPAGPTPEELDQVMSETFDGLESEIDQLTQQVG